MVKENISIINTELCTTLGKGKVLSCELSEYENL